MADDTKGGVKSTADTADAVGSTVSSSGSRSSGEDEREAEREAERERSASSSTTTKTAPVTASAPPDEAAAGASQEADSPGAVGSVAATMRGVATPRRARVILKKVGPWSVLKFSLLFYFFVMIVFLLALTILYLLMDALGTLDSSVKLATELGLVEKGFELNGRWLFFRTFAVGMVFVVLWSIINVFATFLYNLISDVVGGIEVTLAEKR